MVMGLTPGTITSHTLLVMIQSLQEGIAPKCIPKLPQHQPNGCLHLLNPLQATAAPTAVIFPWEATYCQTGPP